MNHFSLSNLIINILQQIQLIRPGYRFRAGIFGSVITRLQLVKSAEETVGVRTQLLTLIEEMPEAWLEEVKDFAEFIQQRKPRMTRTSE
ncbi:hypothetical protein [Lyngbya sp. CCY1209]|jgi:hypothetical protein|uniref:hypothetical protein n=1 Tax=Lyngbya sp. CCY1209 TaxID=2886103 RepID=UPI002D203764|nr:hypothetical protein [Lyngbya sp. CCY1209]MEB3882969.1 DUF2281 domain-containing protein [Lyngbya sp. CCY1209]